MTGVMKEELTAGTAEAEIAVFGLCADCEIRLGKSCDGDCTDDLCSGHCLLSPDWMACGTWMTPCKSCGKPCRECREVYGNPEDETILASSFRTYLTLVALENGDDTDPDRAWVARVKEWAKENQLAQLVADVDRMLLRNIGTASDAAVRSRLERWSDQPHYLKSFFDSVVLPASRRLRISDRMQFARFLRADLASHSEWKTKREDEQELLIEAAFVLCSSLESLANAAVEAYPQLVDGSAEAAEWIVDGILRRGSVAGIIGPPGSGKSTVATRLAAEVGLLPQLGANEFARRRVSHGTALIFSSEDTTSRLRNLREYETANVRVFDRVPDLSSPSKALAAIEHARKLRASPDAPRIGLIVIDLFRDAFSGDENSSGDVAPAMSTARLIARAYNCAVVLVHHSALADEQRARGSSAFLGAVDLCLAVRMNRPEITVTVTKNRSGPAGETLGSWYLSPDGVLMEGRAPSIVEGVGELATRAVASVVNEFSTEAALSKSDLISLLAGEYPELFGDTIKPDTVRRRRARAIHDALKRQWIELTASKYKPGRIEIPKPEHRPLDDPGQPLIS